MKAVLDASVIVRAVLPGQPYHREVRTWLPRVTVALAPHLLYLEIASALRHLEFLGVIAPKVTETALREALRIARDLGLSRARDAAYLALAQREGCAVYSLDERLSRNAQPKGYPVYLPLPDTPSRL